MTAPRHAIPVSRDLFDKIADLLNSEGRYDTLLELSGNEYLILDGVSLYPQEEIEDDMSKEGPIAQMVTIPEEHRRAGSIGIHVGCGGSVVPHSGGLGYRFEGEYAVQFGEYVPVYMCNKCNKSIEGDSELEDLDNAPGEEDPVYHAEYAEAAPPEARPVGLSEGQAVPYLRHRGCGRQIVTLKPHIDRLGQIWCSRCGVTVSGAEVYDERHEDGSRTPAPPPPTSPTDYIGMMAQARAGGKSIPFPLEIMREIHTEMVRVQRRQWPEEPVRRAALVCEEILELALQLLRSSLDVQRFEEHRHPEARATIEQAIRTEAVQVAASATFLIMSMTNRPHEKA